MSLQTDYADAFGAVTAQREALKSLYADADKTTDPAKRDEVMTAIKTANASLEDAVRKSGDLETLVEGEKRNREALASGRKSAGAQRQIQPENDDEEVATGIKSISDLFDTALAATGRKSVEGFRGFRGDIGTLAIKTLIQSSSLAPQSDRQPIQPSAQEERTVADLMLQGTTQGQAIDYYVETTFTNSAAETAEAAAKPESALDFTLRTDNVRKIATWVPVTDEMLADVPAFEAYVRERLGFMVKRREETELLLGSGTGSNIQGIENRTGVQTVTGYGSSTLDSLYHGITLVRTGAFAEPTAIVMHPNDWENVRLSKDGNQNYLMGPATAEGPASVWGLQVRITTAQTENTALVGAFRPHAQIFRRSGIDIAISTENEDYFLKNKVAVRAEERLALAVYRPAAFCKVEAIVVGS